MGPGTKLKERLERGDPGKNQLDRFARDHDIAYSQHKSLDQRHIADKVLENKAWDRVKSEDASLDEKIAAWVVTNIMKVKRKAGFGIGGRKANRKIKKKQKITFRSAFLRPAAFTTATVPISNIGQNLKKTCLLATKEAKRILKKNGGRKRIKLPRVLPLPSDTKSGGILPAFLLPLFGGLSALGSLVGGGSAVAKAISDTKQAQKKLDEAQRHNKTMEAIALGKRGSGLYLKQYKKGLGVYLDNNSNRKNFRRG